MCASVIRLSGLVLRVDVELGDFELFAECREPIESLQQVIDAGDAGGKVALQANTIDGSALIDQVLNGLRVVILMRFVVGFFGTSTWSTVLNGWPVTGALVIRAGSPGAPLSLSARVESAASDL